MMDSFFLGGGFQLIFILMFLLILGIFAVTAVRGMGQWNKNNHSPRLCVAASVAAKRMQVMHSGGQNTASTSYYVTFEVASGDRMELAVNPADYGMLAEGDTGTLTFQGTRFVQFERSVPCSETGEAI